MEYYIHGIKRMKDDTTNKKQSRDKTPPHCFYGRSALT